MRKSCVSAVRTFTTRSAFAKNAVRDAGVVEGRAHDARLREVEERRADREEEEEGRDAEEVARLREERQARESARAGRDAFGLVSAAPLARRASSTRKTRASRCRQRTPTSKRAAATRRSGTGPSAARARP